MFTLAMVILSACSEAISSSTGATILQGPHHSAQKSTRTGLSLPRTSASNVASVTVLVAAAIDVSLSRVYRANVRVRCVIPGRSVTVVGQPALRVERGRTAGAGSGDRLPVGVVDEVAAREHAVEVGAGGRCLDDDVTLGVEVDLAADELVAGI